MSIPTVKRMVLFKHGVAYVERGGPADGSFTLSFAKSEMNDVLKSLAVWVEAGDAKPTAIGFEKPESPEAALDEKGLNLPPDKSLSALVTAMRGRRAELCERRPTPPHRTVRGEIVGLDVRPLGEGWTSAVVVATDDGKIEAIDLVELVSVSLLDPTASEDLRFLLDRRRAATSHERRTVRVGVSGRAEDLRVAYIVPAPVWRVSYRVMRTGDGDEARTMLSAWAIVHNPLDEDASDVALTLTTGQPISFQIDLYHPKHVERVTVEESSRALSAPPEQFERAYAKGGPPPAPALAMMSPDAFDAPAPAGGAPMPRRSRGEAMAEGAMAAADGAASTQDRGELFEYHVAQKVSLARGGSALVPLLTRPVPARRERIWREGSPPSPDLVMAFANESGAVLEEGPAVVYDEGVYAGEAMVPYAARGAEVRFAYAKDLSVRCQSRARSEIVSLGLRFGGGQALEDQRRDRIVTLVAESDHDAPVTVIFELPKRDGLAEASARPIEETMRARRFAIEVPARGKAELTVIETSPISRHVELHALTPQQLEKWRRLDLLGRGAEQGLSAIVSAVAAATAHAQRATALDREKAAVLTSQDAITKQLGVLKEGGPEGQLRLRYVRELGESQDRIAAIDAEWASTRRAEGEAKAAVEAAIRGLVG